MNEDQKIPWLTLHTTPGLSGVKTQQIIDQISPKELLSCSYKELINIGFKPFQAKHIRDKGGREVEICLNWAEDERRHLFTLEDDNYPSQLSHIATPPIALFVEGGKQTLERPQIAMVGSRSATREGLDIASEFSHRFVELGLVVTSGLATGIDGRSHQGCLDADGATIAVLGNGFDHCYPKAHRGLMQRIRESGALVSEFPPYVPPKAQNFPRRNRIISGLSLGVVVVEAGLRSGTLITARFSLEQGREVFAVPGSIHSPATKGCHHLIREGAILVTSADEVVDEISDEKLRSKLEETSVSEEKQPLKIEASLEASERAVYELLGAQPESVDFLSERTHLSVNKVMMHLLELELKGLVASAGGGFIRLRGS